MYARATILGTSIEFYKTAISVPGTSLSSVRPCHNTLGMGTTFFIPARNFFEFCAPVLQYLKLLRVLYGNHTRPRYLCKICMPDTTHPPGVRVQRFYTTFLYLPVTSVSIVRLYHNTRNFCQNSPPVTVILKPYTTLPCRHDFTAIHITIHSARKGGIYHTFNNSSRHDQKRTDNILTRQAHRPRVYHVAVHPHHPPPAKVDPDHTILLLTKILFFSACSSPAA